MQRLTLKTEASLRLRLMQDGISELGFSIKIDSQSELGLLMNRRDVSELRMYISINVNSESNFVIKAEK